MRLHCPDHGDMTNNFGWQSGKKIKTKDPATEAWEMIKVCSECGLKLVVGDKKKSELADSEQIPGD